MILVMSTVVNAISDADKAKINSLVGKYQAAKKANTVDVFKKSSDAKELVRIIKEVWANKYEKEVGDTTDQKRLERIQHIINRLDLPADDALRNIKAKKEGTELVYGNVKENILFDIKPIPETDRTIYANPGQDIFLGMELTPLTNKADRNKLLYKWFDGDLEKKHFTERYLIRETEDGSYNIKLELWHEGDDGKDDGDDRHFKIEEFKWIVVVGGKLPKLATSPKYYPIEKEVILVKDESREFKIDLDNLGGYAIDYVWSVEGKKVVGEKKAIFVLDKCPSDITSCSVSVTAKSPSGKSWSNTWTTKIDPQKTLQELFPTKEVLITRRVGNKVSFIYKWDIPGNIDDLKKDFEFLNRYSWDFDGDGKYETTTSNPAASFDYSNKEFGNYIVRVKVPVIMERVKEDRTYSTEVHYSYSQVVVEGIGKKIDEEKISLIIGDLGEQKVPDTVPTTEPEPEGCKCIDITDEQTNEWFEDESCVTEAKGCSNACSSAGECAKKCWPSIKGENEEGGFKSIQVLNSQFVGYIAAKTKTEEDCVKLGAVKPPEPEETETPGEGARLVAGKITDLGGTQHIKEIKQVVEKNQNKIWIKYNTKPGYFSRTRLIGGVDYKINPAGKWIELERRQDTEYYYVSGINNLKLRATANNGDEISFTAPSGAIKIDDSSIRTKVEVEVKPETTTPSGKEGCQKKLTALTNQVVAISISLLTDPAAAKRNGAVLITNLKQFQTECASQSDLVRESKNIIKQVENMIK